MLVASQEIASATAVGWVSVVFPMKLIGLKVKVHRDLHALGNITHQFHQLALPQVSVGVVNSAGVLDTSKHLPQRISLWLAKRRKSMQEAEE